MTRRAQIFQETLSSVEMLAAALMREMQPGSDEISQRQAYELYGRDKVERWVKEGLVKPYRGGMAKNSKKLYSRLQILVAIDTDRQMQDNIINNNN